MPTTINMGNRLLSQLKNRLRKISSSAVGPDADCEHAERGCEEGRLPPRRESHGPRQWITASLASIHAR